MTDHDDESFIGRWSRRKRHVELDEPAPAPAPDPQDEAALEARRQANREAAERIDLETIDYDTDLSDFFKDGVPALLKQAALRRMWRSNPVFANLDGLNDYDHDYNVIDKVLTTFNSAWQAGRGYLKAETPEDPEEADGPGTRDPGDDPAAQADAVADAGESEPVSSLRLPESRPAPPFGHPVAPPQPAVHEPVARITVTELTADHDGEAPADDVPEPRPVVSLRRRRAMFEE